MKICEISISKQQNQALNWHVRVKTANFQAETYRKTECIDFGPLNYAIRHKTISLMYRHKANTTEILFRIKINKSKNKHA